MIELELKQQESAQIISIKIPTEIAKPEDLKGLKLPDGLDFSKPIIIEGRAPIWAYGYLVHECHPAPWCAVFDPRIGAVCVESHIMEVRPGQVIPVEL